MEQRLEVVEYTDVMCSWAWGSEPKLRLLRWRYEDRCDWRLVMGGLVGDLTKKPNWDPVGRAPRLSEYWSVVAGRTGSPFPVSLKWTPGGSEAAGIGFCAARLQGEAFGRDALRRMREAVFVFGCPPDTPERVIDAVRDMPGLDQDRFARDLHGSEAREAYRRDWEETRRPNDHVRQLEGDWPGIGNLKQTDGHDRYAFPTLLFRGPGGEHTVPGWCDFEDYVKAMEHALPGSTAAPRPGPTPDELFDRWSLITERELETLCGSGSQPPAHVKSHDWGEGAVYLRPESYPSI